MAKNILFTDRDAHVVGVVVIGDDGTLHPQDDVARNMTQDYGEAESDIRTSEQFIERYSNWSNGHLWAHLEDTGA